MELSKSDFAAHINVSPARVSQYLREGTIGPDALVGEGRNARIRVEVAKQQIGARRHIGQSLGNGLQTRLDDGPVPPSLTGELPLTSNKTADLIALERLEQEKRRNRQAVRDEAIANRQLVTVDELERLVRKVAHDTSELYTGMAVDIATAIAAKFELPSRDLQHLILEVMRDKRSRPPNRSGPPLRRCPKPRKR
jgi:hypothetical protein